MVASILPLRVEKVCVRKKGIPILGPVSWELTGAGCTVILGPNGAGKTTFLRLMHGLQKASSGHLHWQSSSEMVRKCQSFVFQTPVVMRRSVIENLIYPLQVRGTARIKALDAATYWLDMVGLQDRRDRPAGVLSGGEKQKLAMARALIIEPQVVFLDEPSTNLDGAATLAIETIIQHTIQNGTRVVLATHDLGQARRLATEVVFLLHGKIHEVTQGCLFFDTPQTGEAKSFLKGDILL